MGVTQTGKKKWRNGAKKQWANGQLSDEDILDREIENVLFDLECHLEAELDWMDRMENEEEEVDDIDDDSDYDEVSEDEGYDTSPEVDFD